MAPSEDETKQETGDEDTGLLHKWCMRCVPPAPRVATALCGYKTSKRRAPGALPDWPACVVCLAMISVGCARCSGAT